ncbi:MAG: type III secretion system export apparatus subunit SctV [Candidatus Competibacteraceae bacterium]|nr:type III secretion system export apparatus subunit SctV [Candidatus Competibacteraceae bacterium]
MTTAVLHNGLLKLTERTDVMLAVLLVGIIFMMILPLPTHLVDVLIAVSMSSGVILLMISVYISSPLAFSAFPSVLLLSTLYRLALSISTTRLILLQADAGQIVDTFGNFVVGGNLIVGLVVFLIITIVQFLVITKGSERVAEVSARFSLDAMPGKQMSIDSDMRAGVIDMDEARRRRGLVEQESQMFGSMDGAMKFVKGDAIAGLIIIVVNILGGVTIGVLQRGMSAADALHRYAILTIGDGLIAQIPALLISITAGIIVTRVSTEESTNLGADIGGQILAQPKALLIGAALLGAFALIPGFPSATFIALGLLVGGIGFTLNSVAARAAEDRSGAPGATVSAQAPATGGGKGASRKKLTEQEDFALTMPLLVDVASALQSSIQPEALNEELLRVRRALYLDLGVPFPGIHLRFNNQLAADRYLIYLQEIPMAQGKLLAGHLLAREQPDHLDLLGIPYRQDDAFLPGVPTLWVEDRHGEALRKAGVPVMEPARILTYHLSFVLRKYAEDFVGIQETRYLLDQMDARFGELVKEAQRILPLQKVTEILQRLVSEDISIRNLRDILEALVEWGQKEKDPVLLVEYVRGSLKRYLSYKYGSAQNLLPAYLLNPDVEEKIRGGIRQTSSGSYLALDPATTRKFVASVKQAVGDLNQHASKPVLVTSMDIRRYVRKLVELELYELPVLSYQELTQEVTIQPLGRVNL